MLRCLLASLTVLLAPHAPMPKRPVALLFHQGAFVAGGDDMMRQQARMLRRKGFKPVRVGYTLDNLPQAVKDARAATRGYGHREVVAYGESAGGGLASLLASKGLVDAAVSYSGVNNMSSWFANRANHLGATKGQLHRFSATSRPSKSPVMAFVTKTPDPFVNEQPTLQWARQDPNVRLRKVGGFHVVDDPRTPVNEHTQNMRLAIRYLLHQVKNR